MERVGLFISTAWIINRNLLYFYWLLAKVLMKDIMTPVPPEEVRAVIKKCLENAALINYNKLASEAKVEGKFHLVNRLFFF